MTDEADQPQARPSPLAQSPSDAFPRVPAPPFGTVPPRQEPDPPAAPFEPVPAPPPPGPSALEALPGTAGRILGASFDLLVACRIELRRGSLYLGLILLLTVGPLVLLIWGIAVSGEDLGLSLEDPESFSRAMATRLSQVAGAFMVTGFVATAGLIVTAVEGQAVAIALLGSRAAGRPLSLRAAVTRSRAVFWRLVRGGLIVGIPLGIVEIAVEILLGDDGQGAQAAQLVATAVRTLAGVPFAYVATGIVIGDVGALEAVRRSVRLASTRRRIALMVAVFAALAQYLLLFGLDAGGDLIGRIAEPLGLDPKSGPLAVIAVAALVSVFILALGTLQFTVLAIATAPQVAAFLSLTRFTGGLDRAELAETTIAPPTVPVVGLDGRPSYWNVPPPPRPFRWLTRPLLAGVAASLLAMVAGVAQITAS
jgi:hypothetical protein